MTLHLTGDLSFISLGLMENNREFPTCAEQIDVMLTGMNVLETHFIFALLSSLASSTGTLPKVRPH